LVDCPFAKPNDIDASRTYLLYATPSLLAPHLLHLIALGIATSQILSGAEGARWRTVATIAGFVLGVAEYYYIATYDSTPNARSTRVNEIDFIYWKMHVYRGLAIAAMDGVLGWVIWLQATGRAFLTPVSSSERLGKTAQALENTLGKARGLGIMRNSIVRDAETRKQVQDYWVKEGEVMNHVFEQPEVIEAQRNALRRLDINRIRREADGYVDGIFGNMQVGNSAGNVQPVFQSN
jgi:hypothetical protein